MLCTECGNEMTSSEGEYRYTESGLDNLILQGVTMYACECGESSVALPNIEELHRVIGMSLAQSEALLSGEEIKFLRYEMELKAVELARLMGFTKTTVSRWENEGQSIDKSYDRMLRLLYVRKLEEQIHQLYDKEFSNILMETGKKSAKKATLTIPVNAINSFMKSFHPCTA